jgi:hypothetical protein
MFAYFPILHKNSISALMQQLFDMFVVLQGRIQDFKLVGRT